MKKLWILTAAAAAIVVACNPPKEEPVAAPEQAISRVTLLEEAISFDFSYDERGRVATMTISEADIPMEIYTWSHSSTTVTVDMTSLGGYRATESYTLNGSGYATASRWSDNDGYVDETTYTYQDDRLVRMSYDGGSEAYTWNSAGNLTAATDGDWSETMGYNTHPNHFSLDLNWLIGSYGFTESAGSVSDIFGRRCAHLVSRHDDGEGFTIDYRYEFVGDLLTKVIATNSDGDTVTYVIAYVQE